MQIQPTKILSSKRITLPDQFFEENKLKEGDFVGYFFSENKLVIVPLKMEIRK